MAIDPRTLTGLEIMQAMAAGHLPYTGMGKLMNMKATAFERGRATFHATPAVDHLNPIGTVHGGFAATVLDSVLGCAVHTTLAAGETYGTVDLHITYLKPLSPDSGMVVAQGEVISESRRIVTARATLEDASGRLVATGFTTCMITRGV